MAKHEPSMFANNILPRFLMNPARSFGPEKQPAGLYHQAAAGRKDSGLELRSNFYSDLMGFYSDLMGFYSNLMGFYSDLMGFYSDLMGY